MTSYDPRDEYMLRIQADLEDNPTLSDLAEFFSGVQDMIYVGGLLSRMEQFKYTVADRLAPELVELTKLSRSFYVSRLQMASPLFMDILTYAGGTTGFIWSAMQVWDKVEDIRLKRSRRQLEMVVNSQLKKELKDVEKYYNGFDERFLAQGHDIRNPTEAIDNTSRVIAQVDKMSIEPTP